jgi:hypothetical protein
VRPKVSMAKASPPEAEASAELVTVVLDVDIDEKLLEAPIRCSQGERSLTFQGNNTPLPRLFFVYVFILKVV